MTTLTTIPYTRVPKASALLVDYLYHFDRVARFYNGNPFEISSYRSVAAQLSSSSGSRDELAEILTRQNRGFKCGEKTLQNIRRLRDPGVYAVVTGQQVGLLSGPAFTLYKALTAIRLAEWLTEQGLPCVTLFWLATEDHDFQEVAGATALDDDYEPVPLSDPGERPAPRAPVAFVRLSVGIREALDRLEALLPPGEPRERLLEDLRESYQPGATWGEAFGRLMGRLFARWGVVLVDPLDEALHRRSARLSATAVARARKLRASLQARSTALIRAGYHAQVHIADDHTLAFATREGNRLPITQAEGDPDDAFTLIPYQDGTSTGEPERVSMREIESWTERRPLDLTPNVLLRPVIQDLLLPTMAYVGGPSELAYLGQAQVLYSEFGRPMPVAYPRAGFTLLDVRSQRLMEKYQLSVEDVWKGEDHLSRKMAATAAGATQWSEHIDQTERELARLLDGLRADLEKVDPTLLDPVKHAREKITYQLERLRGKVTRAALQHSELLARHEQMLRRFLAPGKNLQEREVAGVYFLGRAGMPLLDRLHGQIQIPCAQDHQVVAY